MDDGSAPVVPALADDHGRAAVVLRLRPQTLSQFSQVKT